MLKSKIKNIIVAIALVAMGGVGIVVQPAYADNDVTVGVTMSPMNEVIILNPGDRYVGSFKISNNGENALPFEYTLDIVPFFINSENNVEYSEEGSYNLMMDWIVLSSDGGLLNKGDMETIYYTINVPSDAPAGGQYAGIRVVSKASDSAGQGINIKVAQGMVHLIYAEVTGTTVKKGEIVSADVPGFIFDGNIKASSMIKNTGNVHGVAKYTLRVYPLFSDEEVYTNEEKPMADYIFPERTIYNEQEWPDTPAFGFFNVVYTVEFEGETVQVSKMVIKCPLWMLFVVIAAIIALVLWFVTMSKKRKGSRR